MTMRLFGAIDLSASGLRGQRAKLEVVAENIANAQTTRTPEGGPYRRKQTVFTAAAPEQAETTLLPYGGNDFFRLLLTNERHMDRGREASQIELPRGSEVGVEEAPDATRFKLVYDPGHPDADEEGYVLMPNVNMVSEMVDMIAASRAYEANVSAIESAKDMFLQALEI
jgi:flagellar basal-body rod protein FlgC